MEVSERYLKVIKTACRELAVKTYAGGPFHHHLEDIENILREFGYTDEDLIIAGWLHDIMEEVGFTKNDVMKLAGQRVADIVYLVTDHKGENRDQRKPAAYYIALRMDKDAIVVKLADRIANARQSVKTGHSMSEKYKKEYDHFREMLKLDNHAENMWIELDKIFNYEQIESTGNSVTVI